MGERPRVSVTPRFPNMYNLFVTSSPFSEIVNP
jgi:hypothetical protein